MKYSLNCVFQVPTQRPRVATSRAPWPLLAGHLPLGAPNLVRDPKRVCTVVGSSSVVPRPSIRIVTAVPPATAGPASVRSIAPNTASVVLLFIWATPFHEGCWLAAGGWSPGLWAYLPRLPGGPSPPVACAAGVPIQNGGGPAGVKPADMIHTQAWWKRASEIKIHREIDETHPRTHTHG